MKTYYDLNDNAIITKNSYIPKVRGNSDYELFLQELEKGEAILMPYVEPAPSWEQIKTQRNQLLLETDWVGLKDVTVLNEQAWLDYRQALRDIPENFTNTEDVIWPIKPE